MRTRGLLVDGGVPVRVEEDEAVGAHEVEAAPAGLGGEQEHELVRGEVVQEVHLPHATDESIVRQHNYRYHSSMGAGGGSPASFACSG